MTLSLNWTNWKTESASGAPVTDQGDLATCVAHSLAKGIFDHLRDEWGWFKGSDENSDVMAIIKQLEKYYNQKQLKKKGIDVVLFNNFDVTVHDGHKSMTLRMSIDAVPRRAVSFAFLGQVSTFSTRRPCRQRCSSTKQGTQRKVS